MTLLLDDDAVCTVEEFMRINTQDPDVNHISNEDDDAVLSLQPGEETYIETTKIKRIS